MTDNNNPVVKLYKKLQKAIEKSNLTQQEVAKLFGNDKPQSQVSREIAHIKDSRTISVKALEKYCEIFKVK